MGYFCPVIYNQISRLCFADDDSSAAYSAFSEPVTKVQSYTWRVNRIFDQIEENVNKNLKKCTDGTELDTFLRTLLPSPSTLDYQCLEVKQDLFTVLKPLRPSRIDLFGSSVMGLAFEGMVFLTN